MGFKVAFTKEALKSLKKLDKGLGFAKILKAVPILGHTEKGWLLIAAVNGGIEQVITDFSAKYKMSKF